MSADEHHHANLETMAVDKIRRHQFVVFIVSSMIVSFFMVFVALSLYVSNGTIQLDLSRPGYAEARKEARGNDEVFRGFSPTGPVNQQSLREFQKLYDQKLRESTSVDAFSGDALSDKTLSLD